MDLDVVLLARIQFALTIMVHYLFPPLSIGLGLQLVITEGLFLKTGDPAWESIARFFTRLFAVNFAVGVATGIVMEMEFGTNWATYSRFVGDVFGSALASEGIFAFFLESGFLAVLVFGWDRVGPKTHFFSSLMVFLGSVFSSVWIVIANSWMHTPAGYRLVTVDGVTRAEIHDFWAMIFNPSAMHRLGHVLIGAFILGAFFVLSISSYYLLKDRHVGLAKRAFKVAVITAAVSSFAMLLSGHTQAVAVAKNQPAKMAALEGHFHTGEGPTPLYVIGWPDVEAEEVIGIALPGMLSFVVHEDFETPVTGLDQFPPEDRPPVVIPFLTYHLMVGCGMVFIALSGLGVLLLRGGRVFRTRWLLWAFVLSVPLPYVANEAGWIATEVGRQPWIVQGLLRTRDAVSLSVAGEHIVASIVLFGVIYLALVALWLVVMNEKIQHGPDEPKARGTGDEHEEGARAGVAAAASAQMGGRESMTGRASSQDREDADEEPGE